MLITQFTFKHAIQNILVQDRTKDQPHDKAVWKMKEFCY